MEKEAKKEKTIKFDTLSPTPMVYLHVHMNNYGIKMNLYV